MTVDSEVRDNALRDLVFEQRLAAKGALTATHLRYVTMAAVEIGEF